MKAKAASIDFKLVIELDAQELRILKYITSLGAAQLKNSTGSQYSLVEWEKFVKGLQDSISPMFSKIEECEKLFNKGE